MSYGLRQNRLLDTRNLGLQATDIRHHVVAVTAGLTVVRNPGVEVHPHQATAKEQNCLKEAIMADQALTDIKVLNLSQDISGALFDGGGFLLVFQILRDGGDTGYRIADFMGYSGRQKFNRIQSFRFNIHLQLLDRDLKSLREDLHNSSRPVISAEDLIDEIDNMRKDLLKVMDKGGVTVVMDNDTLVTTYNTNSYKRN